MKHGKRFISLLLSVLMLLSVVPLGAIAATNAVITVKSTNAKSGATVDVAVSIANNPGILGMTLVVEYDESAATLIGVQKGEALDYMTFTVPKNLRSGCNLPWDAENVSEENIKDGTIAVLTFEVSKTAQVGDFVNVSVSYDEGAIIDKDMNDLNPETVAGGIQVLDYTPGDLDDNGIINTTDVVLLRRYIAGGYNVTIVENAGDVNADGKRNTTDVVYIRRYIAGGYSVELKPALISCEHEMQATEAKDATCTEDGNNAYWGCTVCGKYFSDVNGNTEITLAETVVPATGHGYSDKWSYDQSYHWYAATCEHADLVKDRTAHSFGIDKVCTVCGVVNAAEPTMPYEITYKLVEWNKQGGNGGSGDNYLPTLNIVNDNPSAFSGTQTIELNDPDCGAAYTFNGWYTEDGVKVNSILAGTKDDITLWARWTENTFTITYNVLNTPVKEIIDDAKKSYKPSKGFNELPNPEMDNFLFLGWYNEAGELVKKIPVGTTEDIVLVPHYTSLRNLARPNSKNAQPLILDETEKGVILFAYELGTIENIPISEIWRIQSVAGLDQTVSRTHEYSLTSQTTEEIAKSISDSTVSSSTWTLSENWTNTVEVNETWAKENGTSVEDARRVVLTDKNTLAITNSKGIVGTSTHENGITTTVDTSVDESQTQGAHYDVNANTKYTNSTELSLGASLGLNAGLKVPLKGGSEGTLGGNAGLNIGLKNTSTIELGLGVEYGEYAETTVNTHVGTEVTGVETDTHSITASWNSEVSKSRTQEIQQDTQITKALTEVITNSKGYGESYTNGGEGSEANSISATSSSNTTTSSTVTMQKTDKYTETETFKSDGKIEGEYRLVVAGTAHVFAIVGYDVATASYFTYTYSIFDDETKMFLDYTPKGGGFMDNENSVLPFEIPDTIYEYVQEKTNRTQGIGYVSDSENKTLTITSYEKINVGTAENPVWEYPTDVIIPSYVSIGGTAYRVTAIAATAFAGKPVRSIHLSDYITEIPASAFKGCTSLEQICGRITVIGNEAFSGCTKLENFIVSPAVVSVGTDAFLGVPKVTMTALTPDYALIAAEEEHPEITASTIDELIEKLTPYAKEITKFVIDSVLNAGANNVSLDLSCVFDDIVFTFDVPAMNSFELNGDNRTFADLQIDSEATTTAIRKITIHECKRIPLKINSQSVTLSNVYITCPNFALVLGHDGVVINLELDSRLTSQGGKAVVAKNPVVNSRVVDDAYGVLRMIGDFYFCAAKPASTYLYFTSGTFKEISQTEFENYKRGIVNITFDANGGSVATAETEGFYGTAIGTLPVSVKEYHTFLGWFTEETAGEQVTEEYILTGSNELTLFAHWEENQWSEWTTDTSLLDSDLYTVEQRTETRSRTKEFKDNSTATLEGWIANGSTTQYGDWVNVGWTKTQPTVSSTLQITNQKTVKDYTNYNLYYYRYWNSSQGKYLYTYSSSMGGTYYSKTVRADGVTYYTTSGGHDGYTLNNKSERLFSDELWFIGSTSDVTHTEWYYQTRTETITYHFYRWLDWTPWDVESVTPDENTEVETRTVYRYKLK